LLVLLPEGERAYEFAGGRYVYEFPQSGILCVASFDPFVAPQSFRLHARYRDGTTIPLASDAGFSDIRVAALGQRWSVTTSTGVDGPKDYLSDPEYLFAIGNSDQIDSIYEAWQGEKPRFRREYCK
jgi:hypothetical protein